MTGSFLKLIISLKAGRITPILKSGVLLAGVMLALPLVLLARSLRPLILIRFGPMGGTGRIGNLAPDTELYLCDRELNTDRPRPVDLFFYENTASNQQMKKMANRKMHVFALARILFLANKVIPGGETHSIQNNFDNYQRHQVFAKTDAHMAFTELEEQQGVQALQQWGLEAKGSFICFIARDPAYLKTSYSHQDFKYHDHRNIPISAFIPATAELGRRGHFGIRMGTVVNEALATSNPMIFDYATKARTEFLDIYLGAKCRFFLTNGTGIDSVSTIFRRPVACVGSVNWGYIHYSWGPQDMFIPKKYWLRDEGRYMTLPEIFDSGVAMFDRADQFERFGIELIDNTPEEITALALEMDDRIDGNFQSSEEDEELQRSLRSLLRSLFNLNETAKQHLPRMGTEYLRQNRELLGHLAKPNPTEPSRPTTGSPSSIA